MNLEVPGVYLEPFIRLQDQDGPTLARIQFIHNKIVGIPTLNPLIPCSKHEDNKQYDE